MRCQTLLFVAMVAMSTYSFATSYIVQPDGTGDFPTIQQALDACQDSDVIVLGNGTFSGDGNRDLSPMGKAVTVRSQSLDPAGCIIDCQGSAADPHRGFLFCNQEGPTTVLEGVTITGGYGYATLSIPGGGAVQVCDGSSPKIRSCVFLDNACGMTYDNAGGGMYVDYDCDPSLQDCVFRGNHAYFGGGLAVNHFSHVTLEGCYFVENKAVRGGAVWGNGTTKYQCVFYGNQAEYGGGVWINGYNVDRCESCTFTLNSGQTSGGGYYIEQGYGEEAQLVDTIIAGSVYGAAVATSGEVPVLLSCCDLYGNSGGDWVGSIAPQVNLDGNFSADPCFCDVPAEDFGLCADSWCLPGHHPWGCGQLVGAFGEGCAACDCGGPVPVEIHTWGDIKARYR